VLWLALHFPLLPLEARPLRQSPSAVVARGRVLVGDAAATQAGITPGQRLSTALGLLPGLLVGECDPAREAQALQQLACWAGRFTPTISVRPPAGLLLEIGGCLRLFGGVPAIVEAVTAGCAGQSFSVEWAVAPTPLAAGWLARAGTAQLLTSETAMQAALAALPCSLPEWPARVQAQLAAFGLHQLGDMRRLPAGDLRRRIGQAPVDELQRAWGECPDPQLPFIFPEHFASALELPARVEQAEALCFAGQRLLAALAGWLAVRQLRVRGFTLQLTHDDGTQSALPLRLAEATDDENRLTRLLREHLARLRLSGPVEAIALRADDLTAKPGASLALFDQGVAGEGTLACLERIQARLGPGSVQVLAQAADYRPECATRYAPPTAVAAVFPDQPPSTVPAAQPLWLLPQPKALVEQGGRPCWQGPLELLSRPERLESGWWDEGEAGALGDVRRDYFVARNPQGQWAWVFRDAQGWFLHGLFA
jgi:protein ImuB